MTRADYMRQRHVAEAVGFKLLDIVEVTGSFENPARGEQSGVAVIAGLGVVYSIHVRSKTASVAMACWEGRKSTIVGFPFMRHYNGALTAELISTLKSIRKLREQMKGWAPPEKGWDD